MNKLNHIAFIMDGNGRWGLKKKRNRNYGHLEGVKVVQKIVEASIISKIPIISFYVFSSENWKRPRIEIDALMSLFMRFLKKEIKRMKKYKIKLRVMGDISGFSKALQKQITKC